MILVAAMRLFLDESFDKTTMRRIAEAIEYTPGALYGYFKDKDEILYALHERGFDELVARMEEALEGLNGPRDRLAAIGRSYIRFALDNPRQYELMFLAKSTAKKIQADLKWDCGLVAYDILRNEVRAFLASKTSTTDPEIAAFACWSMVHGIVSLVVAERSVFIPPDVLPAIVNGAFDHYIELMDNGLSRLANT